MNIEEDKPIEDIRTQTEETNIFIGGSYENYDTMIIDKNTIYSPRKNKKRRRRKKKKRRRRKKKKKKRRRRKKKKRRDGKKGKKQTNSLQSSNRTTTYNTFMNKETKETPKTINETNK